MKYNNYYFFKLFFVIFISKILISMNSQDEEDFFQAIEKNDIVSMKKIIIKDINVNFIYHEKEFRSFTPLHYATFLGNIEIVKFLIMQNDIDINSKDIEFWTPLHWAVHQGHIEIIKLLLNNKNIEINCIENSNGTTPLHLAIYHRYFDVIQLLIKHKNINTQIKDYKGKTVYDYAKSKKISLIQNNKKIKID